LHVLVIRRQIRVPKRIGSRIRARVNSERIGLDIEIAGARRPVGAIRRQLRAGGAGEGVLGW
jgi:hypothetical protein